MRIHNKLDEILSQKSKTKILRYLFAYKDEHTGRGISKEIKMSPSSTHGVLKEMEKEGLISARRKGNVILYKLREDNYFVKELLAPLFKKEKSVYAEIVFLIKKHISKEAKGIISAAIFGSVAKNQQTSSSDIDILIVTENESQKNKVDRLTDKLHADAAKKFHVDISIYILTIKQLKEKHGSRNSLVKSIVDNNKLIYGEPIERILA